MPPRRRVQVHEGTQTSVRLGWEHVQQRVPRQMRWCQQPQKRQGPVHNRGLHRKGEKGAMHHNRQTAEGRLVGDNKTVGRLVASKTTRWCLWLCVLWHCVRVWQRGATGRAHARATVGASEPGACEFHSVRIGRVLCLACVCESKFENQTETNRKRSSPPRTSSSTTRVQSVGRRQRRPCYRRCRAACQLRRP